MRLSIDTNAAPVETDENESPLGKRKSDSPIESCRSSKRSPLSDVRAPDDINSAVKPFNHTPSKQCTIAKKAATHSSSKFVPRVCKEEVMATDEDRASVHKLSAWLASESAKKERKPTKIVPASNPVRFRMKPKINKEDVEATDDKRVSVKTLSAWISDDPFEQKKLKHIRSGVRVINKSRVFEPDTKKVDVQVEAGTVHDKQAWLSGAFKHEENNGRQPMKDKAPVVRAYQNKTKSESPDKSLMSVTEKKQWLNSAFKKQDCILPTKSFDSMSSAHSPSIPTCPPPGHVVTNKDVDATVIMQQASHDGTGSNQYGGSKSPVRLYKQSEIEVNNPDCLKTVHDKQKWLANAFKVNTDQKELSVCTTIATKNELAPIVTTSSSAEETEIKTNGLSQDEGKPNEKVVSVADRAKWLRGAFAKEN